MKYYKIEGRVAISGNPMTDAKLLRAFETELDAFSDKFKEAGGTIEMRIVTEKEKSAASAPSASKPPTVSDATSLAPPAPGTLASALHNRPNRAAAE